MRIKTYFFFLTSTLLICFCVWTEALGQTSSAVTNLRAKTADGIEFNVWSGASSDGKDVVIHYRVRNQGPRPIYLVKKRTPKISLIDNNYTVLIEAPYPGVTAKYTTFDYSFLRVNPARSRRGTFAIPGTMIRRDSLLPVRIAFGYVTNKYGLDEPGLDQALGELLNSRIYIVVLGELVIED